MFGILGVSGNQGTLDVVRKRGRGLTVGAVANKPAKSTSGEEGDDEE